MKAWYAIACAALLAGCATMQPVNPLTVSEYLVPSSDFTMRLPPFVTIEVLKNQQVPIVGSTTRDGRTYRIALLPAQAAGALRFLINDDGSFEGSAINYAGSRMGFSYTPNPP